MKKKFTVPVTMVSYDSKYIEVLADTVEEAVALAKEAAPDHVFDNRDGSVEYKADEAAEVAWTIDELVEIASKRFDGHINNNGGYRFSEKEYSYMSDALDEIEVGWYKREPDGDNQTRLWKEDFTLTEDEARELLLIRIGRLEEDTEKWVFDAGNCRVVTEDDSRNVFYTEDLVCKNVVIENVVNLHNTFRHDEIQQYLIDEELITGDDAEVIIEGIYKCNHGIK